MRDVLRHIAGLRDTVGIDAAVAALAAQQHGIVARWQLKRAGISDDAIDFRVEAERLHRVYRGAYAVGHRVISDTGRRMAAALTYGDDAVLSHRGAAAHWQLVPARTTVEVTVPRRVRPRTGLKTHYLPLRADEWTHHDGVPVTTVVRTIFDLGIYGRRPVERAIHEAEHRKLYDVLSLLDLLERYPHRIGTRTIRAVLRDPRPGCTENDFEEDFFAWLVECGFPIPRTNVWVEAGGKLVRPDCVFDEQRVIVELDGATHTTTLGRRKDHRRDAALQAGGWRVMRVSWHAFYFARHEVYTDLRDLLTSKCVTFSAT